MKLRRKLQLVPLVAPLVVVTGCATSALWEEGRFAQFREPASPPNLRVFQSREGDDVLVCYDETGEDDSARRARAYWLVANHEPVENPHKPRFVSIKRSDGLTAIPILDVTVTNAPSVGLSAVALNGAHDFALRYGDKEMGNYDLPVYQQSSGRVKQVLLTPLAVVADLTIVGGYLGVLAWSKGGLADIH